MEPLIPLSNLDLNLLKMIVELEVPSLYNGVIRSLSSLKVNNNNLLEAIASRFTTFKSNFLIASFLPDFINNNIENSSNLTINLAITDLNSYYINIFMNDPDHPCFVHSIKYQMNNKSIVKTLFKLPFTSPEIIGLLVQATYGKKRYYKKIIEYYKQFQNPDIYPLLLNLLLLNSQRVILRFVSSLLQDCNRFICFFGILRKIYSKCGDKTKEEIKNMIGSKADTILPQSRFFSLMMLFQNDVHEINLSFIVAASETNMFHSFANEFDAICKS